MDPPLHTRIGTISKTVGRARWNCTKVSKDTTFGWKHYGFCFSDSSGILFIDYLEKGKTIKSVYYCAAMNLWKEKITRKRPHLLKKRYKYMQNNTSARKSIKTMAKINGLRFELLLLHMTHYSPDLTPNDFYMIPNLQRWL